MFHSVEVFREIGSECHAGTLLPKLKTGDVLVSMTLTSFDVKDALDVLGNKGLLVRHPNGTLTRTSLREALKVLPDPSYQWETLGALRDSMSGDEEGPEREDNLKHHRGWQ